MHESQATETVAVGPHIEPTRFERTEENRTIEARWNIGEPNDDGGQRQAVLAVHHIKGYGYVANVTTVIETIHPYGRSDEYPVSLFKWDKVYQLPTTGRYAQKGLTAAYGSALEGLRSRFDSNDPLIVRHFDPFAPIPRD